MVLKWFETGRVREFASEISGEYVRMKKSADLRQDSKERREQRRAKLLEKVREFESKERLNVYRRAVFLQSLRSSLTEAGIAKDEVAKFTSSILVDPLT
ncbi:MAG: hypothetical protein K8F35_06705 [Dokdonella sp.]|uniref:hypothetical protein n=1 Tax=Dokdonella sp. TaxID=2291710 RepID=UPI0025BF8C58|nr:hypothetical protein [Dokdonella sp.]MBZ0222701.1 hypothetical protein [Dokdonella sp.]